MNNENCYVDCFYYKLHECYGELIKLGFDFEKNTARDFIEYMIYVYNDLFLDGDESYYSIKSLFYE